MTKPITRPPAGHPPTQNQADLLLHAAEQRGALVVTKARVLPYRAMERRGWIRIGEQHGPTWVDGKYHELVYVIELTADGIAAYLRKSG